MEKQREGDEGKITVYVIAKKRRAISGLERRASGKIRGGITVLHRLKMRIKGLGSKEGEVRAGRRRILTSQTRRRGQRKSGRGSLRI